MSLLLLFPASAPASTSFVSQATGNWANGATWVGGVAPGSNDTVIIANGHTVTIASGTSVTIGDSANPTTPAIQTAVAGGGTGILIVDTNASLTVKGDVKHGNATWQFNAGSTLTFSHATANLRWFIADGNSQANAKLVFNGGTGASRITVQATGGANGGGFGWFGTNWTNAGRMQATGVTFSNVGTSALSFLNAQPSSAYLGTFTDCQFASCGTITSSINMPVGGTFQLTRTTFRTPLASNFKVVNWLLATGVHTGVAFDRVRWEGTFYMAGAAGASGVTWNDCVGMSYGSGGIPLDCTTTPHSATVTDLLLFNSITSSGNPSQLMNGTIANLSQMRQGAINGHSATIVVNADTTIAGGIWETGSNDESGDMLQVVTNPAAVQTLDVSRIIAPPGPDGVSASGSFLNVSHTGSSANNRVAAHHNTVFVSAVSASPGGCVMVENTTGGAGVFTAIRDNIWCRTASGSGWGVFDVTTTAVDGTFTNVDYNDKFNLTTDGYQPADSKFATPSPPGTHDLTVDPSFVAPSRRLLSWGQTLIGGLTTTTQVVQELLKVNDDSGYTAGFTLAAYQAYMQAGFTPQNAAIQGAGHDGSSLGAVIPPAALASAATLTVTATGVLSNTGIALVGAATLTITTASSLTTSIALTGAAALTVTTASSLTTAIRFTGAATLTVTTASALTTSIRLAGAANLAITTAGALTTAIPLTGAASLTITTASSLTTAIRFAGAANLTITAAGAMSAQAAALTGVATLTVTGTSNLTTAIPLTGVAALTITTQSALTTAIRFAGTASLTVTALGTMAPAILATADVVIRVRADDVVVLVAADDVIVRATADDLVMAA